MTESSEAHGALAAMVLAAGGSRRLGEPKQLLRDATGQTLVRRVVAHLLDAGYAPVIVMTGAEAERVAAEVNIPAVEVVHHAGWADGMGTTIAYGIAWLANERPHVSGVVITACDMPSVTTSHLRALRHAGRLMRDGAPDTTLTRVASTYGSTRGIPALFPRHDWPALMALTGDVGARGLLRLEDTRCVPLEAGTFDLDTPVDVTRWRGMGG